jgi:hypothetical protein
MYEVPVDVAAQAVGRFPPGATTFAAEHASRAARMIGRFASRPVEGALENARNLVNTAGF